MRLPLRALGLTAGLVLVACGPEPEPPPRDDARLGFHLISWWNFEADGEAVWRSAVKDLADNGIASVSLDPVRYFDPATGAIAATSSRAPDLAHIGAAIEEAKRLGMFVTVDPFVEANDFSMWRGSWNPSDTVAVSDRFWADYQAYLVEVAGWAASSGADRLTIGTELSALVRDPSSKERLATLIAAVRAVYRGALGYAANWDSYDHASVVEAIWDHPEIDFIGIDAYFPLAAQIEADASGAHPDPELMSIVRGSWDSVLNKQVRTFAAQRKNGAGMPYVIMEHGLTPYNRTTVRPWSEEFYFDGQPVDRDEQVGGLAAFVDRLVSENEEAYLWHWGMPGAYDSLWFLHPAAEDQWPGSKFDEALGREAARYLVGRAREIESTRRALGTAQRIR